MTQGEPYIMLALTRPEVAFLLDKTSAQEVRTRDLAVRLAGALVELAAVDALRAAQGLTSVPIAPAEVAA